MVHAILAALGPVVLGVAIGWLCGGTHFISRSIADGLAAFIIKVALPVMLFLGAATTARKDILDVAFLVALAAGLIGAFVLGYLVSRLVFRRPHRDATMQALAASFPNMAYCGPPVLIAVVGSMGLISVVVGNIIYTVIVIPIAMVMLGASRGQASAATSRAPVPAPATAAAVDGAGAGAPAAVGTGVVGAPAAGEVRPSGVGTAVATGGVAAESHPVSLWRAIGSAILQPLVILPVAGAILSISGVEMPEILRNSINEIGSAAGGTALFFLGLVLSGVKFRISWSIAVTVVLQNIVMAALILGVGLLMGLQGKMLVAAFIIGVLPSATAVPAIAVSHDALVDESSSTVLVSTLFSILTIAAGVAISEAWLL